MEVISIRVARIVLLGLVAILVMAIPMVMSESSAIPVKKHFGPVPFPPELIPHPHVRGHEQKLKDATSP